MVSFTQCLLPKDNKVNEEAETEIAPGQTNIPFKQFLEMIQPAFPQQATKQDAMACLKRAHWIVNLNHAVYVRRAGVNEDPVPLVTFPPGQADFISDDGKKVLGAMRQGVGITPDTWLEKRPWSHDLVSMLLEGKRPPARAPTILTTSLSDKKKFIVEKKAELPFSGRLCSLEAPNPPSPPQLTLTAVKEEITNEASSLQDAAFAFQNLLAKGHTDVIDLDSPSPRPKRARTAAEAPQHLAARSASDLEAATEEEMDHHFPEVGAAAADDAEP